MKKLKYGNFWITVLKQLKDGTVFSELEHVSGLKSRVLFKSADNINETARMMSRGEWDISLFKPAQRKLIEDWGKEDAKFKAYRDNQRKQDAEDIGNVNFEEATEIGSMATEKLMKESIYKDSSKEYNEGWASHYFEKAYQEWEKKELQDAFQPYGSGKLAGTEPKDLEAILMRLRKFMEGNTELSKNENLFNTFVKRFIEAFKKKKRES